MLHTVHLQPGCYTSQAPQTSCTHLEGMLWLCKSLSHQNVVYCIYSWKHHIPLVHHNCAKSKASWASLIYATAIDIKFIRCQRELNGPTLCFLRGLFPTPDKHKVYEVTLLVFMKLGWLDAERLCMLCTSPPSSSSSTSLPLSMCSRWPYPQPLLCTGPLVTRFSSMPMHCHCSPGRVPGMLL